MADFPAERSGTDVDAGTSRREYRDWLAAEVETEDTDLIDDPGSGVADDTSQTEEDLYAFGGRLDDGHPRLPRPSDFDVESPDDHIGPYRPETPRTRSMAPPATPPSRPARPKD